MRRNEDIIKNRNSFIISYLFSVTQSSLVSGAGLTSKHPQLYPGNSQDDVTPPDWTSSHLLCCPLDLSRSWSTSHSPHSTAPCDAPGRSRWRPPGRPGRCSRWCSSQTSRSRTTSPGPSCWLTRWISWWLLWLGLISHKCSERGEWGEVQRHEKHLNTRLDIHRGDRPDSQWIENLSWYTGEV